MHLPSIDLDSIKRSIVHGFTEIARFFGYEVSLSSQAKPKTSTIILPENPIISKTREVEVQGLSPYTEMASYLGSLKSYFKLLEPHSTHLTSEHKSLFEDLIFLGENQVLTTAPLVKILEDLNSQSPEGTADLKAQLLSFTSGLRELSNKPTPGGLNKLSAEAASISKSLGDKQPQLATALKEVEQLSDSIGSFLKGVDFDKLPTVDGLIKQLKTEVESKGKSVLSSARRDLLAQEAISVLAIMVSTTLLIGFTLFVISTFMITPTIVAGLGAAAMASTFIPIYIGDKRLEISKSNVALINEFQKDFPNKIKRFEELISFLKQMAKD